MIPTIEWHGDRVRMIDQRKIPRRTEWYVCRGYRDVIKGIRRMVIRGAPAIGVAAAMGLALAASTIRARTYSTFARRFREVAGEMLEARPTAVNLQWAVERMTRLVDSLKDSPVREIRLALRRESEKVLQEDIEINRRMGRYGQSLIPRGSTILTHCNAGSLATGGYGTALGVIRAAHEKGKGIQVIADGAEPISNRAVDGNAGTFRCGQTFDIALRGRGFRLGETTERDRRPPTPLPVQSNLNRPQPPARSLALALQ